MSISSKLVDARNIHEIPVDLISDADFVGIDLETHDNDAHQGIKTYRKSDTAKVFDMRRTTITGLSVYADGADAAYYFNLGHSDVENRLSWLQVKPILEAKKDGAYWVAHNAPFELVNLSNCYNFYLEDIICTLQMAVSCYGPDEYNPQRILEVGLGEMAPLVPQAMREFADYQPREKLTRPQEELLFKVIGKQSHSSFSYNGYVNNIAYGYGLKKAVKSFFGVQMASFEDTLGDAKHMGELTGEQVVSYGCDDSYYAVKLMHKLNGLMSPELMGTFLEQENPMVHVYASIWRDGMKVNARGIEEKRDEERVRFAEVLRELRSHMKSIMPFPVEVNPTLSKRDKWYAKNPHKYRDTLTKWVNLPDQATPLEEALQVCGSISKPWAIENGISEKSLAGPSLSYYMYTRLILYDLMDLSIITEFGKTQSDGDAKGRLLERLKGKIKNADEAHFKEKYETYVSIIKCLNRMASIEQAMKLYLNPYMLLKDPDTNKVYPVVSSRLASRRMAASFPNPMQLAKHGESVYVRNFFEGDDEDHVIVSLDWSQVELVLIGELSGDPEFAKAYGQLPYDDLHKIAAADLLSAMYSTTVTPEQFTSLKKMDDDVKEPFGFPLIDAQGNHLTPKEAYSYNRGNPGGKGANFGYWYSGALASVANLRGVSSELMWEMTDRYRQRFTVGERWRINLIEEVKEKGFITLPDHHRRTRYEATQEWAYIMREMFGCMDNEGLSQFGNLIVSKVSRRSYNQAVNSMIQGSCGTLAKRSIIQINKEKGDLRARFLQPIHDELVFSAHKDDVADFIPIARRCMTNHPDIISKLKLNCTASVGKTFVPYHPERYPFGQIELDEAQDGLPFLADHEVGKPIEVARAMEYLDGKK